MIPDRITEEDKRKARAVQAGVWIPRNDVKMPDRRQRMVTILKDRRRKPGQENS